MGLPTRQPPPAAENRLFAGIRRVGDGGLACAAIFLREDQGIVEIILAAPNQDGHGFGKASLGLERAHGIPRSPQRRKRSIRALGVGFGQPARPGVVSSRRYKERCFSRTIHVIVSSCHSRKRLGRGAAPRVPPDTPDARTPCCGSTRRRRTRCPARSPVATRPFTVASKGSFPPQGVGGAFLEQAASIVMGCGLPLQC